MVRNGIDRIEEAERLLSGRRIGLVTSVSGVTKDLLHNTEVFRKKGFQISALLAPEHGVRGEKKAGESVSDSFDRVSGLPVKSLYREGTKHISEEVLSSLDVLVYDIQDIGARFYTYISLLCHVMEDAKKAGLPLLILDRVNPLGGAVSGNILKKEYFSYVGISALPQRHGMTVGELSRLFDAEIGLGELLHIIPVTGWKRRLLFPETGLPFVPPSPNIPNFETALVYVGTCLFEGTNVSEGRGTASPFLQIGAPYLRADEVLFEMRKKELSGVGFTPAFFTPTASKHAGKLCEGVRIHVTDANVFHPLKTAFTLLFTIKSLYEKEFILQGEGEGFTGNFFSHLTGTRLFQGEERSLSELFLSWEEEEKIFLKRREPYLLYE